MTADPRLGGAGSEMAPSPIAPLFGFFGSLLLLPLPPVDCLIAT